VSFQIGWEYSINVHQSPFTINFNRYFYKYTPPRPLDDVEADLKKIEKEIADMLVEMTE
jgi:type I restriction enzyme M protein